MNLNELNFTEGKQKGINICVMFLRSFLSAENVSSTALLADFQNGRFCLKAEPDQHI